MRVTRPTKPDQATKVRNLLDACPSHLWDEDWIPNPRKQYCEQQGCHRALCEHCASHVEDHGSNPTVLDLWCWEHRPT